MFERPFSTVPRDVLAGLTLLAVAVPEQLATARLAGLPPESGLYAFVGGSIGFALLGHSRVLSAGADSTTAPIFAGGLAGAAALAGGAVPGLAALLAVQVGVLLLIAGALRAGWVADLLSAPVTAGFLAGIAVHILVAQLPPVLGVPAPEGTVFARLAATLGELGQARPAALAVGLGVLGATVLAEAFSPRVPGALAAIVLAMLVPPALGIALPRLDALPAGAPAFLLPPAAPGVLLHLLPLATIIALVCMMQTAAVSRAFAEEGRAADPARDFAGVGAGCLLASLLGAFPVNASPPRTAVIVESGGRSQLASLVAVALTVALLGFGGGLVALVPQAALGGVLLFVAGRILRLREILRIARRGGAEILLVIAAAALVVLLPIEIGVLFAILLSLGHSVAVLARPRCEVLARVPGTTVWWPPGHGERGEREPGVQVFAPAAPLNFVNADYVMTQLQAAAVPGVRLVVIEASGVTSLDYTASMRLQETIRALRARGVEVALARLASERAQDAARRTGLLDLLGEGHLFRSAEEAVQALRPGGFPPPPAALQPPP